MKLSIPVINAAEQAERESLLRLAKEAGAERVFITFEREPLFGQMTECYKTLAENIAFYKNNGMETGVWIASLGFGSAYVNGKDVMPLAPYTPIKSMDGREMIDAFCPTSEGFVNALSDYIRKIAELKPDVILLDDELCLSIRPGFGCVCDAHLKLVSEKYGKPVTVEEIIKAFSGEPNKLRSDYVAVMGETLTDFCLKVRQAIDSVAPEVRCGFCAGFSSYDMEGAMPQELTKALAGNTKPILRLTGAPYWATRKRARFAGQELGAVCEFIRSQIEFLGGEFEDIMVEEDSYPRPRYIIPSSFLELTDIMVCANGGAGVLKYMNDYCSSSAYERGYYRYHAHNSQMRSFVEKEFAPLKAVGVYVYDKMNKVTDSTLPPFDGSYLSGRRILTMVFNRAASMLSRLSIPTVYSAENIETAIAFGQNAIAVEKLPRKLIIDFEAACVLMKKGIDVGMTGYEEIPPQHYENYNGERIQVYAEDKGFYKCSLKEGAKVISTYGSGDACCYSYKSGDCEMLVYTFDAQSIPESCSLLYSYVRQQQLIDFIGCVPAIVKNPSIYALMKTDGDTTALLYENIFEDPVFDAEICLGKNYKLEKIMGAEGKIEDGKLKIKYIQPMSAVAVVLKRCEL